MLNLTLLIRDPTLADRKELTVATALTEELLRDIRGVVSRLRDADGIDVGEAFRRLVQPVPDPRIHVQVAADARVDDAAQAETLVRLAQEGITNAIRHAAARNVWLTLSRKANELELAIEDDGRFKLPLTIGNGLRGMRERIAAIGGEIEFGLGTAGGFRIHARLPQPYRA